MTTITIPARDLQPGDRFDFCGRPGVVAFVIDTPANAPTSTGIYFDVTGTDAGRCGGSVWVQPGAFVTVERPDPDADLIERMAQAIHAADHTNGAWDEYTDDEREDYLALARAALAVVRADQ